MTPASQQLLTVRLLGRDDAAVYQVLRLEGLQNAPTAFGSSYEDEATLTPEQVESRLVSGLPDVVTFGAFSDGRLVGIASLVGNNRQKTAHRAMVSGMYVTESARGQGVGMALLQALIQHAEERQTLEELVLAVTLGNTSARRVYDKAGFTLYATEPRYLKIDGKYYDLEWMFLRL
jgi:L-amino acid N-acyltransferase YncA